MSVKEKLAENPQEEAVIIPQKEYNYYQEMEQQLEKEKANAKTWQEKYMDQVAQNKKLQEENKNNGKIEEEKKKFQQVMQEVQGIYDESQKLEKGIIKLIKSFA